MEQNFNESYWKQQSCPKYDCKKESCKCGLKKVFLASALGDDSEKSPIAPKNGAYCNAIVVYEANNDVYIYSSEGIPTLVEAGGSDIQRIIKNLENGLAQEILDRQAADETLQGEIDDIKNSPDVVDIVATYADLQAYDTSKLGDNDIIRVLTDENHDGASTYYRWDKSNNTFVYIGEVGDYYTKGQVDTLLGDKQDKLTAGSNINISAQNVISATDTTYSDFVGATIQQAGVAGLVPAPTTSDPDKYLKGDGSWNTPTDTTYTAGTNVQISSGNVISATDTTYSNFVGTDGQTAGTAGLVPAPATTDADKFLKSDGTWDTAGGGGGGGAVTTLTTDDYNYPIGNPTRISLALLPSGFYNLASNSVKVDLGSSKQNMKDVLFYVSQVDFNDNMYILLYYPRADVSSGTPYIMESYLGSPSSGNIFTQYTKHIVDLDYLNHFGAFAKIGSSAPTTATEGNVGQIFVDGTTQKGYLCVGASGGTYTWKEITLS